MWGEAEFNIPADASPACMADRLFIKSAPGAGQISGSSVCPVRVGSRGEYRSQSWLRDHSQPPASSLGDGGHGTTLSGRLFRVTWPAPRLRRGRGCGGGLQPGPLTRRRPRVTWGAGRGLGQRPEPWSAPRQPAPAGPSHGRRGLLPGAVRAAGAVREGEPGQLRVL